MAEVAEVDIKPDHLAVFGFRIGQAVANSDQNAAYRAVDSLFDQENFHGFAQDEEEVSVLNEHGLNHRVCMRLAELGVDTIGKLRAAVKSKTRDQITELYCRGLPPAERYNRADIADKIMWALSKVSRM